MVVVIGGGNGGEGRTEGMGTNRASHDKQEGLLQLWHCPCRCHIVFTLVQYRLYHHCHPHCTEWSLVFLPRRHLRIEDRTESARGSESTGSAVGGVVRRSMVVMWWCGDVRCRKRW